MSDRRSYPSYEKEIDALPASPNLLEHLAMLNVLSNEAGDRVRHRDGEAFRQAVYDATCAADEHLSKLARAHEDGDVAGFRDLAGSLSGKLADLSVLAEEGMADIGAEMRFFKMTTEVCKRVEKMEELKSGRMAVMNEGVVMKLVDAIPRVLSEHLSSDRASQAYAEIIASFKGSIPSRTATVEPSSTSVNPFD